MFCYVYLDPRKPGLWQANGSVFEYEPIYVGIGSGNRHKDHLYRKDVHPLTSKIKSMKKRDILPIIYKIADGLTEEAAKDLEIKLIAAIGRKCLNEGPLTNITAGGDGNFNPPPEIRKKLASNGFAGKNHSEETKKRIGESNSIHPTMKSRGYALGKKNLGRRHSEETNKKKGKSGAQNSRAKTWMVEEADGQFQTICGCIKKWCAENSTSYHKFRSKVIKLYSIDVV